MNVVLRGVLRSSLVLAAAALPSAVAGLFSRTKRRPQPAVAGVPEVERRHALDHRLGLALDAARMAAWEWSLEDDRLEILVAEQGGTRWSPHRLLGREAFSAVHAEDRKRVERELREAVARGGRFVHEFRLAAPPGAQDEWLESQGSVVRDAYGRPLRVIGVARDVTDRRLAELALRESEAQFRQLAAALPQVVWTAGGTGRVDYVNERLRQYTGRPADDALGAEWAAVLHPEDRPQAREAFEKAYTDGRELEIECRIPGADGECRWFLARAYPVRQEDGAVARWFGTFTDIDAQKRLESALREADRRKDQFLAMLAHELRNPLAAIRNGLQITQMRDATAEQAIDARRVIERQIGQMVRLIDDLLDVNRIVSGRIELRQRELDLAEPLRTTVEAGRVSAQRRGIALTLSLPPSPVLVRGDRTRLEQVFANLLMNAVKYTDPGGAVAVSLEREDGDTALVRFRDSGIGLEPQDLERVFEPFVQADHSGTRAEGGLGIGLTLVRRLLELHGGDVRAASEGLGRGSEFTLRLPAVAARAPEPPPAVAYHRPRARALPQRVLVADDNADSAASLSTLLELLGNEVRTAADGVEAVRLAEQFRPEVVLLDLGMPHMDGYEAARRIRAQPWAAGALLVALSGWSQDEDKARSREAGFDHHLVKPVEPERLDALMQERGRRREGAPAEPL